MALAANNMIKFADLMDHTYNQLKSSINNLDGYTGGLASNGNFSARTLPYSAANSYSSCSIAFYTSEKPALVSSATFKSHWDSFMSSYGFTAKANKLITLKSLIHFLTCVASYVSSRFVIVTNPLDQGVARAYIAYGLSMPATPDETKPISGADITAMLQAMKTGFSVYKTAPCNISWSGLSVACSSCSCSSSYTGWYDISA